MDQRRVEVINFTKSDKRGRCQRLLLGVRFVGLRPAGAQRTGRPPSWSRRWTAQFRRLLRLLGARRYSSRSQPEAAFPIPPSSRTAVVIAIRPKK